MATIAEQVVSTLLAKLIEPIIVPIKRQFNYLCCFNANVANLEDETGRLAVAKAGLLMKVDAAENNGEVILPAVMNWLSRTTMIEEDAEEIKTSLPNVSCFSFLSRYSLSKRAKDKAKAMKTLRDEGNFNDPIAMPAPPAAAALVPFREGDKFESRKKIEEGIMKALTDKATMIGICGMGGVGKTTMAKKIMNRVKEENLFDETVITTVSQSVDLEKIQLEIIGYLGLQLESVETLQTKAHKLRRRLTSNTKRTLIILDDIWKELNLDDLGIPRENCTILLTSRSRDVLDLMEGKVFAMEILSEEEAWSLFREKAGARVDDEDLVCIAKEVAKECKGLPIALVTVGKTLKGKRKHAWEDSLSQLRSSHPSHLPIILKEVYFPLRLSYDFLEDGQARSMFLLCSLFPEDTDIELEELTWYMVGLYTFESLEAAKNRVFTIVDTLRDLNLLLDGEDEYHLRIHDVIRDVAIFIASEEGIAYVNYSPTGSSYYDREWISVFPTRSNSSFDRFVESNFPILRLLLVYRNQWPKFKVNDLSFLEGMERLNVLSFRRLTCEELPQASQWTKYLRNLQLYQCEIDVISVIGQLLSLEILICVECSKIEELPVETGKLKQLKLLNLSHCWKLKRIAPGVISNLVEIEDLRMLNSFDEWESGKVKKEERKNASIIELESLSKLRCLEIQIKDCTLVTEELHFPSNIVKYRVSIGVEAIKEFFGRGNISGKMASERNGKYLCADLSKDINLGSWFHNCVRNVEYLVLYGDGANKIIMSQLQITKRLEIVHCGTIQHVVNATNWRRSYGVFPFATLESLKLKSLPCLEKVLLIEGKSHLTFPKLKRLELSFLSNVTTFCEGIESIEFPLLDKLTIVKCPKMISMISSPTMTGCSDDCLHFFCNKKVMYEGLKKLHVDGLNVIDNIWCYRISPLFLQNLKTLEICNLENMKYLFLSSMAEHLFNLKSLRIAACNQMENIIIKAENEEMEIVYADADVAFQKLVELTIEDCSSLKSFCRGMENINFPLLKNISIKSCPKLVNIVSSTGNEQNVINDHSGVSIHWFCHQEVKFGGLETLRIDTLDNIDIIWCPQISPLFLQNLGTLEIYNIQNIKWIFMSSMVEHLVNLKSLTVEGCNQMENVIAKNENEEMENVCGLNEKKSHLVFQKLVELRLQSLSSLESFCKGIESIDFPLLKKICIYSCPKLVNIVSSIGNKQNVTNDHSSESFHWFCHQEVKLGGIETLRIPSNDIISSIWCRKIPSHFFENLKRLEVYNCNKIKSLFSCVIAENLVNLWRLEVGNCREMEKIINNEDETKSGEKHTLFPSLEQLYLLYLPMLKNFCESRYPLEMPMLESVDIHECWEMEFFSVGNIYTPKLDYIKINGLKMKEGGLNEAISDNISKQMISATRILNAMESATHTFFEKESFYYYHTPIVNEDTKEMFQVTNIFNNVEELENDEDSHPSEMDLRNILLTVKEKGETIDQPSSSKISKSEIIVVVTQLTKAMEKFSMLHKRWKLEDSSTISKRDENFDYAVEFFARQAFFTLSEELQEDMWKSVYTFWPTFPARNSHNSLNLANFFMMEAEIAFADVQDLMNCAEAYVKFLCQWLLDNCFDNMESATKTFDREAIQRLQAVVQSKFHRITYTEAIEIMEEAYAEGRVSSKVEWGTNLDKDFKCYLVNEKFEAPVIVYDYPKAIKPFYVKVNDDTKTVAAIEVYIGWRGVIVNGSQREENNDLFEKRLLEVGLPIEPYEWYLRSKPYATMKHSGFQFCFKEMISFVMGVDEPENMHALSRFRIV